MPAISHLPAANHPVVVLVLFCLLAVAGCEPQSAPSTTRAADRAEAPGGVPEASGLLTAATKAGALSPGETVCRLHACRLAGRYREMLALIAPRHRESIMELVRSGDELIAAEAHLKRRIREIVGEGSAMHFRACGQVANIFGPFSRDMEVIGESTTAETARVTIQVASRVPLETVDLELEDGRWLLVPDDPIPGLAQEVRNLASATRRVTGELQRRRLTARQIHKELALRQAPVFERIAKLAEQARAPSADADTP